ncbi:ADP-ribosylation factor-like protein 6-interacting protein 4 [Entelurus aequoreus]|uniref:ADP-ribosylation factor-like protein 6-interacting protein 4 n=1 Tax=Entelurus aequoreus TaxID=161455 RepID=UPI002B1D2B2F|nr:ADP-ribosylation factor-like protein 6-interacting protein 4 [Entelurus aequoreus]
MSGPPTDGSSMENRRLSPKRGSQVDKSDKKKKRRRSSSSSSSSSSSASASRAKKKTTSHKSPDGKTERKKRRRSSSSSSSSSSSTSSSSSDEMSKKKSKGKKKKKLSKKKKAKLKKQRKKEKKKLKKKLKKKKEEEEEEKKKKMMMAEPVILPVEKPPSSLEVWQADDGGVELGPVMTDEQKARLATRRPLTKEEYDARQSVIRKVVDPETGRTRLVRGEGEIIEEMVSREKHKDINKQATKGDGNSFQRTLGLNR